MRFKEFMPLFEAENAGNSAFSVGVPSGDRGPVVADVQKALLALGYQLPRHGVDGIRGPETSGAIADFQLDNNLAVSGIVDQPTADKLNSTLSAKPELLSQLTKSTDADVKTSSYSAGPSETLQPVAYDAVTKGKIGKFLNLIAGPESGGYYDIMQGGKRIPEILNMSLADLLRYQRSGGAGGETAAAGRYQFMPNTLKETALSMGLDFNSTVFSPKTQDELAIYKLRQRGLDKWLSGSLSDTDFLDQLSQEWASLPSPSKRGNSWYQGLGSNRALVSLNAMYSALDDIKNTA